jgi:PAS domain S-box-containing protein
MILTYTEYETLVEQAPIMIWRSGTDKLCNYFNDKWLSFTGRTTEQEVGNGWVEGVHPDDIQSCVHCYVEHFDYRQIFEMEYRLRRYDGEYRWIFDRGVPYYDEQRNFCGYIGSCIDVTDKIEAQYNLEQIRKNQIDKLKGLLPICSGCKKIRDDKGYWSEIESYIQEHTDATLSHGLCPDCMANLYPEAYGKVQQKKTREST